MNRDRLEGHWKQTKGRARKGAGRRHATGPSADAVERDAARARMKAPAAGDRRDSLWRSP